MKAIKASEVERALGGHLQSGSLQFTGASASQRRPLAGHPARAYNSASNWPGARFPESNFWDVVPKLLSTRAYTNLVLLSPTSDLTNLIGKEHESSHEAWAKQSAMNMFHTMQKALRSNPSLKKVCIFEMLPRMDGQHLSSLASIYNTRLRELVATAPFDTQRIVVLGHPSLAITSQAKREAMFGLPSNPRSDGIHLRGVEGSQCLTHSIVEGLKSAVSLVPGTVLPWEWKTQGRRGAASNPAPAPTYSQVATGNRYSVLNC